MWRRFRIKLVITMVVFAVVIAFLIAWINHLRITDQVVYDYEFQLENSEETVTYSLHTIDKAYHYFNEDLADRMAENTRILIEKYKDNPQVENWEMQEIYETFGMHVYLINEENVIVASSEDQDIGLDFEACCGTLAEILDKRRLTGAFYHDGLDLSQATGEVTKFSYMATPDKKYLIELGHKLEDEDIFQDFNFFSVIRDLKEAYTSIEDINILNIGGLALGSEAEESSLSPNQRAAFEKTLDTGETHEVKEEKNGRTLTYHYVAYDAPYDFGSTQNKVIEIVYNDRELQKLLTKHQHIFLLQLGIIILVTIGIALIISKWVARPMYMAFHDNLTRLRNRAAFEEDVHHALHKEQGLTALIMLDLDHFKSINDLYGHIEGDRLLQNIAKAVQQSLKANEEAYRFGGDEFGILVKNTSEQDTIETAERIMDRLNEETFHEGSSREVGVTASIGIAFAEEGMEHGDQLYREADEALKESKNDGKNQYKVFG